MHDPADDEPTGTRTGAVADLAQVLHHLATAADREPVPPMSPELERLLNGRRHDRPFVRWTRLLVPRAAVAAVFALALVTWSAAQGTLPDPFQQAISRTARLVGIELPDGDGDGGRGDVKPDDADARDVVPAAGADAPNRDDRRRRSPAPAAGTATTAPTASATEPSADADADADADGSGGDPTAPASPGHRGHATPGKASAPGQTGSAPGHSGTAPGRTGTAPPGRTDAPGQNSAPSQSRTPNGAAAPSG